MNMFRDMLEELKNYVRKEDFLPVKALVYGMVTIILTAVIGALVTLVLRK